MGPTHWVAEVTTEIRPRENGSYSNSIRYVIDVWINGDHWAAWGEGCLFILASVERLAAPQRDQSLMR